MSSPAHTPRPHIRAPLDTLEQWAERALSEAWVREWAEGAIFPREMVFLLASLDAQGIRRVVESGRQDGYSTLLLGAYADDRDLEVVSIDIEADPERAQRCRERVSRHSRLRLVAGDATSAIGRALAEAPATRTAVLIDGPKGYPAVALNLAAAAAFPGVALLAQHNLPPGSAELHTLARVAPTTHLHYEETLEITGPAWEALAAAEREFCGAQHAIRSLDHSSLIVLPVDEVDRSRVWRLADTRFGTLQPPVVAGGWRVGAHELVRQGALLPARVRGRVATLRRSR